MSSQIQYPANILLMLHDLSRVLNRLGTFSATKKINRATLFLIKEFEVQGLDRQLYRNIVVIMSPPQV